MKKPLLLALFTGILLSACAKERTTPYYSTEGMVPGKPITYVLTNEDYEKQQAEAAKKKAEADKQKLPDHTDQVVKPDYRPNISGKIVELKDILTPEQLLSLFDAMNAEVEELGMPEGVLCEFIPQLRQQKNIGRLTCMKQSPIITDEVLKKSGTHVECSVNTSKSKKLGIADKTLYEFLNVLEVDESKDANTQIIAKRVGAFYCLQVVITKDKKPVPAYQCGVEAPTNSEIN